MLVIKRIHVRYQLVLDDPDQLPVVERVHGFHADKCPVARSIRDAIAITTEVTTTGGPPPA